MKTMLSRLLVNSIALLGTLSVLAQSAPDMQAFERAEQAIQAAIDKRQIPGAVLVAGTGSRIVYRKAYGDKALLPTTRPMAVDTVFDLASLTKPIATATSVMVLVDQGKIRVSDPVTIYLPEFAPAGKDAITIEMLLLHRGGLIADNPLSDYSNSADEAWQKLCAAPPRHPPGTKFEYTDVGFIVLGKLVERVSGQSLDQFARQHVFVPLAMRETGFLPDESIKARCAPTEKRNGEWMLGVVHDPRSFALGGVAGHAGLFGTADDVARWCQMMLNNGTLDGNRILSGKIVDEMTTMRCLPDGSGCRGYGVDINTRFSPSVRGNRFAPGTTYGHTGWTGTSFWIDPKHDCFVVLLTNRNHPDGQGDARDVRRGVASAVAEAFGVPLAPATQPATQPSR